MKPKNFALVILVIAIIGLVIWWFMRPTIASSGKTAEAPSLAKTDPPMIATHIAQVEPPKLPPAIPNSTDVVSTSADPQTDLKTAISDIARLFRDNDLTTFEKTYSPPGTFDPVKWQEQQKRAADSLQNLAAMATQHPEMQQQIQHMQQQMQQMQDDRNQSWEVLVNETPTYNATGDEATYVFTQQATPGNGPPVQAAFHKVFIKINGKWYFKGDAP